MTSIKHQNMNKTPPSLTHSQKRLIRYQIEGWLVVLVGLLGFIVWAASYPINQGLSGTGYLVTQADKVQVNAPASGLVTVLYKKAGDEVMAGDLLLEYDTSGIESNQRSNLETIKGLETSNQTLKSAHASRKLQINALQNQYQANQQLVNSGFASQNSLANLQTQLALAQSEALELQSRIEQNESKLKELLERNTAIQIELKKQKIIAPINGTLMNVVIKSAGTSITAGSAILEIIPTGKKYVIEARIPIELGDRIEKGNKVQVIFPSILNSNQYPITGQLDYVSADKFTDEKTNQNYFQTKVSLNELNPEFEKQLRVGLPAVVIVKSGPRTLLSYLLQPIKDRLSTGLQ